jgi:hypothetical protein
VLLGKVSVRAVHVGQEQARGFERLAVQREALDRARGAEVGAAEAGVPGDLAGGGPVHDREEVVAEVEQHDRVVVRVGGHDLSREVALTDAHARECRDTARRPEDAGQGMQGVDGHVVERPASRLAEVPARIDRRPPVRSGALGLVLVVAAEGGAADRPAQRSERAVVDQPANLPVVRPEHLAGRGDDPQVALARQLDELGESVACGISKTFAARSARPATGSHTAVTRTRSWTSRCARCGRMPRSAIVPAPTTPRRTGGDTAPDPQCLTGRVTSGLV